MNDVSKKEVFKDTFLPMSLEESLLRGWEEIDVVFVTGDAYVDHPSFAMAVLGRTLEKAGFRVCILSQPDWKSCLPWRRFGKPRLFYAISAGNMDSMLNHYTANRKVRNDDAYSPGGEFGLRPDRATLVYCQRAKEAYPGVPVIAGGVEASLRRIAHYDFWSDTVKCSIILDSKADLLVYGMGEKAIVEIARRFAKGESVKSMRDMRGIVYALGAGEKGTFNPPVGFDCSGDSRKEESIIRLPSFEEVKSDKEAFAEATRLIHLHSNPYNAKVLVQPHGSRQVVVNPPFFPLAQEELDGIYELSFVRRPHPSYAAVIPAFEMIKDSITLMRGCFGGCSFCSITQHQGRIVQSRSQASVLAEVRTMVRKRGFKGIISDVGGPTANMYRMRCGNEKVEKKCRQLSCLYPKICKWLQTDHTPLIELLKRIRNEKGLRKVLIASGIRMDLALCSEEFIREVATHHVGGYLKVAPEHSDPQVLEAMRKPGIDIFLAFVEKFNSYSRKAGKREQFLIPYFISGHPGCDMNAMVELAIFLKDTGFRPQQMQDFVPAPLDIATCIYYTGKDPFSGKKLHVARGQKERRLQRALIQFFMKENYHEVRTALEAANRRDLIGRHFDALIPEHFFKRHSRTDLSHPSKRRGIKKLEK